MRGFIQDAKEGFLNHFVSHVPSWHIRRIFYRAAGMKIGKGSYILMGAYVMGPQNIVIGERTYINEKCLLDGRGGLAIGNDASISIGTQVLSCTHESHSSEFTTINRKVIIGDNVWTGIDSIILPGTELQRGCILAAGSVAVPSTKTLYEVNGIYSGVPAKKIGDRNLDNYYHLGVWKPHLR